MCTFISLAHLGMLVYLSWKLKGMMGKICGVSHIESSGKPLDLKCGFIFTLGMEGCSFLRIRTRNNMKACAHAHRRGKTTIIMPFSKGIFHRFWYLYNPSRTVQITPLITGGLAPIKKGTGLPVVRRLSPSMYVGV